MSRKQPSYPSAPFQAAAVVESARQGSRYVTLAKVGTFGFGTREHWLVTSFDAALPANHPSVERVEFEWSARGEKRARAEYDRRAAALLAATTTAVA